MVHNNDVWLNLKTNWNDFYWLTGETPQSFKSLVHAIDEKYPFYHRANRSKLNIQNQVSITFYCQNVGSFRNAKPFTNLHFFLPK